ncbi:MAG: universal stress protein [Candidatus Heimdallarchaeota archaeon]|nr:universal stress protein [Candidatus Heimdallarchaeota archaeon]
MKKVLIAVGDFESGAKLINNLMEFFGDWVTEIHLLNVIDRQSLERLAIFRGTTPEEAEEENTLKYESILENLRKEYDDSHLYITIEGSKGLIAEKIIKSSKKEKVDFIVMGTRRESITKRLIKNHVRYVIEISDIPVLLFPV